MEDKALLRQKAHLIAYQRQSIIREILRGTTCGTTACCICRQIGKENVEIKDKGGVRASYGNLQHCKAVWVCPLCSLVISQKRRVLLGKLVANQRRAERGVALVSYTVSHTLSDPLSKTRDIVREAHAKMHSGKGWQSLARKVGWVGSVRAAEVTFGENGWHFHYHDLAVTDHPGQDFSGFQERWQSQVDKLGGYASDEHGIKITEATGDLAEYTGKWGVVPELVLGHYKLAKKKGLAPFQLLDLFAAKDNKRSWADLFFEYYDGTKGLRQLYSSPNFREFMRETDDPTPEDAREPLAVLDSDQWYRIWHEGKRGECLNAYAEGFDALQTWLIDNVYGN